jgi:maltose-binding protein MalE
LAMFGNKDMIKIHPYTFTNHTQLEKVIENWDKLLPLKGYVQ